MCVGLFAFVYGRVIVWMVELVCMFCVDLPSPENCCSFVCVCVSVVIIEAPTQCNGLSGLARTISQSPTSGMFRVEA